MKSGQNVSIFDIPMMSDERWQQLARENAVHNYIRENGREPDSVEAAIIWQRQWLDAMTMRKPVI
ncbi:hypothetical protein [Frisingicoccus sp.]|uniref:hypothetical protein n=1 Tax=Frisingicoccus sp. TaxID=1918627 RepID=UPI003AB267B9